MTKENKRRTPFVVRKLRRIKRFMHKKIYYLLFDLNEGNLRISWLSIAALLVIFSLLIGFALPSSRKAEAPSASFILADDLTNALTSYGKTYQKAELLADATVFFLPDLNESTDLSPVLSSPLYGFYLTGKELSNLPELSVSFSKSTDSKKPYIGGLSYTYNPYRIRFNRVCQVLLSSSKEVPSDKELYYVIGDETVFSLFHAFSNSSFHLLSFSPKDSFGNVISDYSSQLLLGKEGCYTLSSLYKTYLTENRSTESAKSSFPRTYEGREVTVVSSLNTAELLSCLNSAGYFILFCFMLLFVVSVLVQPYLRRIILWYRVYRIRHRKRSNLLSFRLIFSIIRNRFEKKRVA